MDFDKINQKDWKVAVSDKSATTWQENWFLDGDKARILFAKGGESGERERGLEFYSGPNTVEDASHSVIWTHKEFKGPVKISFDYTRLDQREDSVCIIYLLAKGSGKEGFDEDITKWNDKRKEPAMNLYFNNMNLYHISFAAFGFGADAHKYIRARQYRAGEFQGTAIEPDYNPDDFFDTDKTAHLTAIKYEDELYLCVENETGKKICSWKLDNTNLLDEGRIGIRQMGGRCGRFANIEISQLEES